MQYALKFKNWLQSVGLMKPDVQFGSYGDNSQENELVSDNTKHLQDQNRSDQS